MERAEIAELFYNALIGLNDPEIWLDSFQPGSNGSSRQLVPTRPARNPFPMLSSFSVKKAFGNWWRTSARG